jgi:hypothetical protein
MFLA